MSKAAMTILGAGAFGLSCAFEAARRGVAVRVIDPFGVGAGSSGGIVGALAPHTPENWNDKKAFQFESLILARHFWPEVEAIGGLSSGYGATGRVQAVQDARQLDLAHARALSARALWQGKARWEVRADAPDGLPSPTGFYIHDTLSARLHPAQACAALAAAVRALGGEIVPEGTREGVVIHATGWQGLQALSAQTGTPVGAGVKGQALLFDLDLRDLPQIYAQSLHIIPHRDGTTAVGSTSERDFDSPFETDDLAEDLKARAIAAFAPLGRARELRRWAGVRPRAKSRAPMLGGHPLRAGEFIANGGFKIGFGMAPLAARALVDLALDGVDAIPPAFKPEASF
ncbi:Glycine oxidase [Aquimixticola soesokkakensis]|uniref:Glycine oxidase n=1 Tax=Aquimixticola soesokkakensis TaxID=1519096 RepID=A0A1Y5RKE6_9RHOB|nr:FAD-binding oxidoreductase [Aquimixticola soesokkakensis]SLN16853.1 Glycine oxidase [Aquimixticola soesokkakensis]